MILRVTKFFNRFAVAFGGFLIFVGIIVIGFFLIGLFDIVDLTNLKGENLQRLSLLLFVSIGLIDLLAGIILWRR
jgi:hypothetical protein